MKVAFVNDSKERLGIGYISAVLKNTRAYNNIVQKYFYIAMVILSKINY